MYAGGNAVDATTPDVLSCDVMRDFWLSWSESTVAIGSGRVVDENSLVRHTDSNERPVHALTFRTDFEVNGTWEFPEYEGDTLLFKSRFITDKIRFSSNTILCF